MIFSLKSEIQHFGLQINLVKAYLDPLAITYFRKGKLQQSGNSELHSSLSCAVTNWKLARQSVLSRLVSSCCHS